MGQVRHGSATTKLLRAARGWARRVPIDHLGAGLRSPWPSGWIRRTCTIKPLRLSVSVWPMKHSTAATPGALFLSKRSYASGHFDNRVGVLLAAHPRPVKSMLVRHTHAAQQRPPTKTGARLVQMGRKVNYDFR